MIRIFRPWFWRSVACLLLLCFVACGRKKPRGDTTSVDQPHPPDVAAGATALATLERTGCYGECPVYRLTIGADGSVVYIGTRYVKVPGRQEYKLTEAQLGELEAAFARSNFMQLRDYDRVENTDDDWAHTSLRRGSVVKRVRHYHGDNAAPPALNALEDEFDRITDSARFVGAAVGSTSAPAALPSAAPAEAPPPSASVKPAAHPNDNAGPPDEVADPDNHP